MHVTRQKFGTRPVRIIDRARQAELRESGGRALFFLGTFLFLWICAVLLGHAYINVRMDQYQSEGWGRIPDVTRVMIRLYDLKDWMSYTVPLGGCLVAFLIWRSRTQASRRLMAILIVTAFLVAWGISILFVTGPLFAL